MTHNWREFFPLDSEPREGQIVAIESILEAFESGKDTYLLEGPTGSGKSAIGVTIARYMAANQVIGSGDYHNGAYFLTTQKILQQQYLRDFSDERFGGMLELKSATNYRCGYDERQSCGESKRALTALGKSADNTNWKKHCTTACCYSDAKREFVQGLLGITNYSYFMAETTYAGKLEPRDLLVLDECHHIDEAVCKFVEVEISDSFCKKYLALSLCKSEDPDRVYTWMDEVYRPALSKMFKQIQASIQMYATGDFKHDDTLRDLIKQNDLFDKHLCKVNRFIKRYDPAGWIVNREKKRSHKGDRISLQFKPIDATAWAEENLLSYGRKRLLMSATILDKELFCRSLGLDQSKTAYLSLPSTFPVENRPVHYMPIGKMSMREIDSTLPVLVEAIRELLSLHSDHKGIIHTANFKIARHIRDAINDPRLLVHDDTDRDQVLEHHLTSSKPTVLVSPSMTEGISLDDDLSRFQIVAKLPYPNLMDKALKKRIERDPWYYDYLTLRAIVQSLGRSVRHENDSATSYILDECFGSFMKKNRRMIPNHVLEAIDMGKK